MLASLVNLCTCICVSVFLYLCICVFVFVYLCMYTTFHAALYKKMKLECQYFTRFLQTGKGYVNNETRDVSIRVFGGYSAKNTKNRKSEPNLGELLGLFSQRSSHRNRHWSHCVLKGRLLKCQKVQRISSTCRNVG